MSSNSRSRRWKNKKNDSKGNNNKNKPAKQVKVARPAVFLKPLVREIADCPVCGKPIKDITSALSLKEEGVPAHFDCVLAEVKEKESLGPDETIIYLGNGDFGIVNEVEYRKGKLQILRKVGYEQLDKRDEWRYNMRQDVDFQRK